MTEEYSKKILIVEDDEVYRNNLKDLLSKNGYMAICAEDGEQALEYILSYHPSLILLDLLLPKLHGLEVLKRLRGYPDGEVSQTPVIVISNLSEQEDIASANQLGVAAYFVKAHTKPDTIIQQINLIFNANTQQYNSWQKSEELDLRDINFNG